MKVTIEKILSLDKALGVCSEEKELHGDLKYAIARNINRIKPFLKKFQEDEEARVKAYCRTNEKGEYAIIGKMYDFGNNREKANEKFKEMLAEVVEFDVYTIKRSEHTDKLPAIAQSELLDVIILDE